jgi:predicted DNA-binding transcriptional regulator AlpA
MPPMRHKLIFKDLNQMENLIAIGQVASQLKVSTRTVFNLIKSGKFPPPIKIGRKSFWLETDTRDYIVSLFRDRDNIYKPELIIPDNQTEDNAV